MLVAGAGAVDAQERDPEVRVLFRRARIAQQAADQLAAKALYDSVLAIDSTYAAAYNNRGNVRLRLGDLRGAIDDYTAAIRHRERYALAYYNRADARHTLGDPGALDDLTRAIEIDSGYASAWYDRGSIKYRQGAREAGLSDIRRAAALNHAVARRYLASRGEAPPKLLPGPRPTQQELRRERNAQIATDILVTVVKPRTILIAAAGFTTLLLLLWLPLRLAKPARVVHFAMMAGERQLWIGEPRQGLVLRPSDAFGIPFSLFWMGIVVLLTMVLLTHTPVFAVFAIPLFLFGLYFLVGRFFYDAWTRKRTTYALTSQRVIIARRGSVKSLDLATLPDVRLEERRDGSGTISFGPTMAELQRLRGKRILGASISPAFEMIAAAAQVHKMIHDAQQKGESRQPPPMRATD